MTPSTITARAAALTLIALVALAAPDAGAVGAKDRRFFSARAGIGVDAPAGWTISTHTGYPSIIVLLLHPDGSRISVAVAETPAASARELVELNRKGLEAQKLAVTSVGAGARGGVEVASRAGAREESLVQLYMLRPLPTGVRQAIVISLFVRTEAVALHRPAFDGVVAKLMLETPETPASGAASPATAAADGRPPANGGAGRPASKPASTSAGERPLEKDRR